MKTRAIIYFVLAAFCLGCAVHKPQQASQAIATHSYVELQPDWRIRVVVPILKSGGYSMKLQEIKSDNGTVQLKTPNDFLGYEIDYYGVQAREAGGIAVRFQSAEVHMNDGKTSHRPEPRLPIFQLPPDVRFVRLAFLSRVTPTEHDAVILAASSRDDLESLTTHVETNPSRACTNSEQQACSWVPEGVSVQPEKKKGRQWIPAT